MIVTIDGTAGSGKSTTAREVAKRLGFKYIDTGATYRAVALLALKKNLNKEEEFVKLSQEIKISFNFVNGVNHVYIDNEDVTQQIRTEEVSKFSSLIATYKGVRENLVALQREIGKNGNVICEGRDAGTVVFPSAEVKIYMDADIAERARRRAKELKVKDATNKIKEDLEARDLQDKKREHSPLKIPEKAFVIDTTNLSIEEEIEKVINIIKRNPLYSLTLNETQV